MRIWEYDWGLDLDIKSFFDTIPHDLLLRAVRHQTQEKWVLLDIKWGPRWRWRTEVCRIGTPQGSVVSPCLANLFLHYAFDLWMDREFPDIPLKRYADDGVCHCRTERQAEHLRDALDRRLADCGLTQHPQQTRIVCCRGSNRKLAYPHTSFDFLGHMFRPRRAKTRWGKYFVSFLPAISNKAGRRIR